MYYAVYEDGKPCSFERYPEGSNGRKGMESNGWVQYRYDTFEEAKAYLNLWRGWTGPSSITEPNQKEEFYETVFEIREEE